MPQVDQYVSITEAKNRLLDIIRRLKTRHEVLAITHNGVPAAVLLSMDQYDGLVETIELLADQKAMRSLKRSLKQGQAGRWLCRKLSRGPQQAIQLSWRSPPLGRRQDPPPQPWQVRRAETRQPRPSYSAATLRPRRATVRRALNPSSMKPASSTTTGAAAARSSNPDVRTRI